MTSNSQNDARNGNTYLKGPILKGHSLSQIRQYKYDLLEINSNFYNLNHWILSFLSASFTMGVEINMERAPFSIPKVNIMPSAYTVDEHICWLSMLISICQMASCLLTYWSDTCL